MKTNVKQPNQKTRRLVVRQRDGTGINKKDAWGVKNWGFICSGEFSDSPVHQGNIRFNLGWNTRKTRYALELMDFGDDLWDDNPYREIVAVVDHPGTMDGKGIAGYLVEEYRKAGGKQIDIIHETGEYYTGEEPKNADDPNQMRWSFEKPNASAKDKL